MTDSNGSAAAKPIRDELREQQRAALVAHLVHSVRVLIPRLETCSRPYNPNQPPVIRPAVRELQLKLNASGA